MVEIPWASVWPDEVVDDFRRARAENDPWDIYDFLAYYLDIISPNEMIHDGDNDLYVDFPALWLGDVICEYWEHGNPRWDKDIKAGIIASTVYSPAFTPENIYYSDWKNFVELLRDSDPVVSDSDVAEFHKKYPGFVQPSF